MATAHKVVASGAMVMHLGVMATIHQASAVIVHDHDVGSKSNQTGCGSCHTPFLYIAF
jgi:hypothetical protein